MHNAIRSNSTTVGLLTGVFAAALLAAGCGDALSPERDDTGAPAFSHGGAHTRVTGRGAIGLGTPTPGSHRQEFDFDVAADLTGRLFYLDWSVVRDHGTPETSDDTPGTLTVDPTTDPSTGITSFRETSTLCELDPTNGAEFDGVGRLDRGPLARFTVIVCDNGAALDFFRLDVAEFSYSKSGTLIEGDIVKSTGAPPPPATRLVFTVQPSNTAAGSTISPAIQVTAQDDAGNTVTGFTGTVTVAIGTNPGGGTLSGTTSVAAVSGVATFSNLRINKVGTGYTLVATAVNLASATSAPFNITPRQAAKLVFTVQPQNTLPLATMPPVEVKAEDAHGNTATGFTGFVTIAIGRNGGLLAPGQLSGTKTVQVVNGYATFSDLSIDQPGSGYTLVANSPGLQQAQSASFDVGTP